MVAARTLPLGLRPGVSFGSTHKMLDIGGFLTSVEFLTQLAALITAILSAFVSDFITMLFGGA